jgi:hypothetical protein
MVAAPPYIAPANGLAVNSVEHHVNARVGDLIKRCGTRLKACSPHATALPSSAILSSPRATVSFPREGTLGLHHSEYPVVKGHILSKFALKHNLQHLLNGFDAILDGFDAILDGFDAILDGFDAILDGFDAILDLGYFWVHVLQFNANSV